MPVLCFWNLGEKVQLPPLLTDTQIRTDSQPRIDPSSSTEYEGLATAFTVTRHSVSSYCQYCWVYPGSASQTPSRCKFEEMSKTLNSASQKISLFFEAHPASYRVRICISKICLCFHSSLGPSLYALIFCWNRSMSIHSSSHIPPLWRFYHFQFDHMRRSSRDIPTTL